MLDRANSLTTCKPLLVVLATNQVIGNHYDVSPNRQLYKAYYYIFTIQLEFEG